MSYQDYIKQQLVRVDSKWGRKWHYDEIFKQQLHLTIDEVDKLIDPKSICCMGCRSATEVFEFKERYPKAQVYGVDITDKIKTIRTHLDVNISLNDFNKLPEDWENKFDLVFSNSLDHAYVPEETMLEWWRVTQPKGHLLIEFSTTRPNKIEHELDIKEIDILAPKTKFKHIYVWESPDRNIFTGFFEVIK